MDIELMSDNELVDAYESIPKELIKRNLLVLCENCLNNLARWEERKQYKTKIKVYVSYCHIGNKKFNAIFGISNKMIICNDFLPKYIVNCEKCHSIVPNIKEIDRIRKERKLNV